MNLEKKKSTSQIASFNSDRSWADETSDYQEDPTNSPNKRYFKWITSY